MPKAAKSKKVVHPNSRQAARMVKQSHRDQKLEKRQKEKLVKVEILGEKLKWFQENLEEGRVAYSKGQAQQLIQRYLHRFDEELEQIEIVNSLKGRSGQQHLPRKKAIDVTLEREIQEYNSNGLEIPDLLNGKNLKVFRDWNGEMRYIQNIKMRHVKADTDTKNTEASAKATSLPNQLQIPLDNLHSLESESATTVAQNTSGDADGALSESDDMDSDTAND